MTTADDLQATIIAVLQRVVPGRMDLSGNTNIVRDLSLDSLAVMNFILDVEDEFDISMPLDRVAGVETVDELTRVVATIMDRGEA